MSKDLATKGRKNPRQIPDCKSCRQELGGEKCPLLPFLVNEGKARMRRVHTGKLQANWETIPAGSEVPMDYSGVQKISGTEESLSKQWEAHASFLHTLRTRRTDHWEDTYKWQRACWALMCGRWEDAHGWSVEVAFTCWAPTRAKCEIKLTDCC